MRVAMCDDNRIQLLMMENLVKNSFEKFTKIENYAFFSFYSSKELIAEHKLNPFDIVFLDIDMPAIDGFQAADLLVQKNGNCKIIYVTSHSHLAADSFRHNPYNFIVKARGSNRYDDVIKKLTLELDDSHIAIDDGARGFPQTLDITNVVYFKSSHTFADVHFIDGTVSRSSLTMAQIEVSSKRVFRVNRNTIINMEQIYLPHWAQNDVEMNDGSHHPISRRRFDDFKAKFFNFYMF